MAWGVEYTVEFETWWIGLDEEEQIDIDAAVGLLEEKGPHLPYPYSSDVKGAKYGAIRELRIQLIGGRKTGGKRWYEQYVPLAERIYEEHLKSLQDE